MNRQELEEILIKKAWGDSEFKKQLLNDPKSVIEKELGQSLPENFLVRAIQETFDTVYIRIPRNPEELSEDELDNVAGGLGIGGGSLPGTGSTLPGTGSLPGTGGTLPLPGNITGVETNCQTFSIISM